MRRYPATLARLLRLLLLVLTGSTVTTQSASPCDFIVVKDRGNQKCVTFPVYEICGLATQAIPRADWRRGEQIEYERTLQDVGFPNLKTQHRPLALTQDWPVAADWNGYASDVLGDQCLSEYDDGLISNYPKILPRSLLLPATHLVLLLREPIMRVDLDAGKVATDRATIKKFCASLSDNDAADVLLDNCEQGLIGLGARELEKAELMKQGNLLSKEDLAAFEIGKKAYLDMWRAIWSTYFEWEALRNYLLREPRHVYLTKSPAGVGPRVDAFANFYIPDELFGKFSGRPLAPEGTEVLDPRILDLIMIHEAGHLKLMPGEMLRTAAALVMNSAAGQAAVKLGTPGITAAEEQTLRALFKSLRSPDEARADLWAMHWLRQDKEARALYIETIRKFEEAFPARVRLLEIANQHVDAGYTTYRLIALFPLIMENPPGPDSPMVLPDNEVPILRSYAESYLKYFAQRQTTMLMNTGVAADLSPWSLEAQMIKVWSQWLR